MVLLDSTLDKRLCQAPGGPPGKGGGALYYSASGRAGPRRSGANRMNYTNSIKFYSCLIIYHIVSSVDSCSMPSLGILNSF